MKKKLLLLLITLMMPINIKAETIYGEYHKVNDITNKDNTDFLIHTTKFYNTYNIEKVDKGYLDENNLYEKELNDFIEIQNKTNINTGSKEYIDINYMIEEQEVNYVYLTNIFGKTIFNEIKIYNKNKEISYNPINQYQMHTEHLNDNDETTTYQILTKYEIVKLNLKEKIKLKDLKIVFITNSKNNLNINIPEYNYNFNVDFTKLENINKHEVSFVKGDNFNIEHYFLETKKLYRYYEYINKPTNIYLENSDNVIENDYKIETTYYKRDKLVLSDDMILHDEEDKIDKFVIYASDIVFINCNINYKINGNYTCDFKLGDINVKKNILVDIKKEEEQKNENETINKKIGTKVNNEEQQKSLKLKSNRVNFKNLNNENESNKKEQIVKKKEPIKETKNKKKYNKKIFILIILIVEILLFILKRYKKFCRKSLNK